MSNAKAATAPAAVIKPADSGKTEVASLSDALIGSSPDTETSSMPPAVASPLDHDGDGRPGGAAPAPAMQTYLTTHHSDRYGPGGRFVDLSPEEAAPGLQRGEPTDEAPEGAEPELTVPTADQLSRRRPAP